MELKAVLLQPMTEDCPYLDGLTFVSESMVIPDLEHVHLDSLLSMGFRHFGEVFFRPICRDCRQCIPIRVPVQRYNPSRSVRRLFNRAKHLDITLEDPETSDEAFDLYCRHKKRFEMPPRESYEQYVRSFYYPYSFNKTLCIRDPNENNRLVAVSHMDVTTYSMSAIYCYFDEAYARFSPGKLSVYKELELAKQMGVRYLYLGYYVPENRHMNYKIQYKPSQLLMTDHIWIDYVDETGEIKNPLPQPRFRLLADYFGEDVK